MDGIWRLENVVIEWVERERYVSRQVNNEWKVRFELFGGRG